VGSINTLTLGYFPFGENPTRLCRGGPVCPPVVFLGEEMQKDNFEKPKRKVIRLPDYDYARNGLYYLTLCTHQKKHLFGFINDEKMNLNQAGKMMEYWFFEIEKHFETTKCIANQIMPNHIHCILEIDNQKPGRMKFLPKGKLQGQ